MDLNSCCPIHLTLKESKLLTNSNRSACACRAETCELLEAFILRMQIYLFNIYVKFEHQSNCVKVRAK